MRSLSPELPGGAVRPPAGAFRLASDGRLTRLAAAGDEGAMAAIFERHHQPLHRYCYSILGNGHDASDALQNTMICAMGSLPGETRQIALRPWLFRIAHNESISLLRARRAYSQLDAAVGLSDEASAGALETRERLQSLTEDLVQLTERQRGALLMRELGGLAFTEVADALGTSAAAVKQSVYEARRALHAMEEGRSMQCDAVQRTLSDGDRRVIRATRMRGHLRGCAGCRDFELALHKRAAALTATIPPLPAAAATSILHGILGGASAGGGGLVAGVLATGTAGFSLGANAIAILAVGATLVGGAVYAVPRLEAAAQPIRGAVGATIAGDSTRRLAQADADVAARGRQSGGRAAGSPRERPAGSRRPATARAETKPAHAPADTPVDEQTSANRELSVVEPAGKPHDKPVAGSVDKRKPVDKRVDKPDKPVKPAVKPDKPDKPVDKPDKPAVKPGGGPPAATPGGGPPASTPGGGPAAAGNSAGPQGTAADAGPQWAAGPPPQAADASGHAVGAPGSGGPAGKPSHTGGPPARP